MSKPINKETSNSYNGNYQHNRSEADYIQFGWWSKCGEKWRATLWHDRPLRQCSLTRRSVESIIE